MVEMPSKATFQRTIVPERVMNQGFMLSEGLVHSFRFSIDSFSTAERVDRIIQYSSNIR